MPLPNDNGAACFLAMGTGKSKIAVDIANLIYWNLERPIKVLAIGPDKAVGVWTREFDIHSKNKSAVTPLVKYTKSGTRTTASVDFKTKLASKTIQKINPNSAPINVISLNYESSWRAPLSDVLINTDWDLLILDESHRVQNPEARSSKFILELAHKCNRRMILTGTEIGSAGVSGVFSQMAVINTDIFGENYSTFLQRYAETDRWGSVVGTRNKKDLSDRMESVVYRATQDALDLPEVNHVYRYVDLAPEAAKAYRQMAEQAVLSMDGFEDLSAQNVLAQNCRLQQICGGFVGGVVPIDEETGQQDQDNVKLKKRLKRSAKAEELKEIIEDIDPSEPIVVFCRFKEELKQIEEIANSLNRKYSEVSGNRSDGLTDRATLNPETKILGAQIQAAGTGVDFTLARFGIYYSKDFSVHNYRQSVARLHRPGQKRDTTLIHLITSPVHNGSSVDLNLERAISRGIDLADWFIDRGVEKNIDFKSIQNEIESR